MNEIEFNLQDEPWILVINNKCEIVEVSLIEALLNAHIYKDLKGEIPTQDVAILRILLAILHAIYSRVDEEGQVSQLDDEDEEEALNRWKKIWDKKHFSEKAITEYMKKWHERFWLFHPERPFGQVANLKNGTDYAASKLNGEISESSNKKRIFSAYSGDEKESISYSQAVRWLIYLNAFDDTSAKPTKEGKIKAGGKLPSPGAGWLGKIGIVYNKGNTLFETLMLNMVMINEGIIQSSQTPIWEKDNVSNKERVEIPWPQNLSELYTIQSRRILLNRKENLVNSFKLLGGDFFEKENYFFEPMTAWKSNRKDNNIYTPKRHDSSRQIWRDFAALYVDNTDSVNAISKGVGTINWFKNYLYANDLVKDLNIVKTTITAVEYGDKDFFVNNIFYDSLSLHSSLLGKLGANWRNIIKDEIEKCEKLADVLGEYAQHIYVASGGSNSKKDKHFLQIFSETKLQLFYKLDIPFRGWIININADDEEKEITNRIIDWHNQARKISYNYASDILSKAEERVLIGHIIEKKLYSAPKAMNILTSKINKLYNNEGG